MLTFVLALFHLSRWAISLDTIADFARHEYGVKITCEGFGNVSIWNANELKMELSRRRLSMRVEAVERVMKCTNCGEKQAFVSPWVRN